MLRGMLIGAVLLATGSLYGVEPVKVTPRLVEIIPIKYSSVDRDGFALTVAFDTEDGSIPNHVSFIVCTALVGWELLDGKNSGTVRGSPEVWYECIRPKSAVETLHFGRYELTISEAEKRYHYPRPQPFHELRLDNDWREYFSIQIKHACVWGEAEIVEREFCEALNQYQWKHKIRFQSSSANTIRGGSHNPEEPLIVQYWADLPEQDIKRGVELVQRLAKEHKIRVVAQKGSRLLSGGAVPTPVESVDLPERRQ